MIAHVRLVPTARRVALCAALALTCCGRSGSAHPSKDAAASPKPPPLDADPASPACRARVDRLAAALAPNADHGTMIAVPAGLTPPVTTAGRPVDQPGPVVQLDRRARSTYDGKPVTPSAALTRTLDASLRQAARDRERMPPRERARLPARTPLYLLADGRARVGAVEAIAARVPAGFDLRLVVLGPMPHPVGYDAAWRARPDVKAFFDGMAKHPAGAGDRAVFIAKQMQIATGYCTPLIRVFGQVASQSGESKGQFFAREAPRALAACDCKGVHLDLLEATLLGLFEAWSPAQRWLPLDRRARGLPAGKTVADLARASAP
jgi:hypothetical protein